MRPTGSPVRLSFDGREIEALDGETIAAALAAADIVALRQARSGAPRGPFCGMGVCFDCLVTVDGRPSQRACLTKVAAGMDVRSSPAATASAVEPARPVEEIACDVLVVGAGPAGLSAARAWPWPAPRWSCSTSGSIRAASSSSRWRPRTSAEISPSTASSATARCWRNRRCGRRAHRQRSDGVGGLLSPEVAAIVAGQSQLYRPRRLVLAAGAYEQAPMIPGWTLPGVMTVGGLQTLARSYRVAPGRRIVIAGNGPLCLQTAVELVDGGAEVVAVLEAAPRPGLAQARALASAAVADPFLMIDGLSLAARLAASCTGTAERRGWSARSRARRRSGRSALRGRHRGVEPRLRLVVGAGALAGLRPSLRAARPRLDGDADRRQRPHQPCRGLRHRRRRTLRRRPRGDR